MSKFNLIDSNICNNGTKNNKGKKEKKNLNSWTTSVPCQLLKSSF